jgi:hypothetical protein
MIAEALRNKKFKTLGFLLCFLLANGLVSSFYSQGTYFCENEVAKKYRPHRISHSHEYIKECTRGREGVTVPSQEIHNRRQVGLPHLAWLTSPSMPCLQCGSGFLLPDLFFSETARLQVHKS